MRFEWDEDKAEANIKRHGVRFEDARFVFADPLAQDDYDGDHSDEEKRFQRIGMDFRGRLLTVTYTMRDDEDGGEIYRLITAWEATRQERRIYEEGED